MRNFLNRLNPNLALLVFVILFVFGAYLFFTENQRKEALEIRNSCAQIIAETVLQVQDSRMDQAKFLQKLCEDAGGVKEFRNALKRGAENKDKVKQPN
ncbi:hypothetical protein MCEGE11_01691 [Sphingomonadaceae bacterium]|jgi:hypothetical protein